MSNRSALIFLFLGLLLVPFMPSHDSLWIDEAQTWAYANQPDLGAVIARLKSDNYSEAQMPLGMVSAWAGAQILGKSEWQMRAQNMLWVVAGLLCFFRIGKLVSMPALPLLLAIQPFTWYYANEFRPYALQIFSGSMICWGLVALFIRGADSKEWILALLCGILISCSASMLGVIPSLSVAIIVVWHLVSRKQSLQPSAQVLLFLTILLLALLGLHYLSTLMRGAGGAKIWAVGPANLVGAVVEVFGFSGLLPARQALRDLAHHGVTVSSLAPFLLPIAGGAILFAAMAFLVARSLISCKRPPDWCLACSGYFALSFLGLIGLALAAHFPFWGRHLAPAFPAFVLVLGFLVAGAWETRGSIARIAAIVCCGLLLGSSLVLRLSPAHSKDDYRSAAEKAREAVSKGGIAWWAADKATANYYGVFPVHAGEAGSTFFANSRDAGYLEGLPTPDIVLLSKEDLYDREGALKTYLTQRSYKLSTSFPAFTVWEQSGHR